MSELIQEISHFWIHYFSLTLIQNTVFIGLLLLILTFYRNSSVKFKYFVCLIGVLKFIIPPFMPYHFSSDLIFTNVSAGIFDNLVTTDVGATIKQYSSQFQKTPGNIGWIEAIFLLWVTGVFISILMSVLGLLRITLILRNAAEINGKSYSKLLSKRNISVYISDRIPMPLTLALYQNRIFVPDSWNKWDEKYRRMVLNHEESHLQRHDNLIQILQIIAQALFFFHPFIYLLNKKINLYREMICDDQAVLTGAMSPVEYSKCLTEIAEKAVETPLMYRTASAIIPQKSNLTHRIQYQMKEGTMSSKSKKFNLIILAMLVITIPLFSWYISSANAIASEAAKLPENVVDIQILAEDDIHLYGKKLSLDDFKSELNLLAKKDTNPVIQLKFGNMVSMHVVFAIQKILRDLDLLNLRFVGDENRGLNLILPNTASKELLDKISKKDLLTLTVTGEGQIERDGDNIEISELARFVKEYLDKNQYIIVSIKVKENVVYKQFVEVLDQVGKSGCKRILIPESIQ